MNDLSFRRGDAAVIALILAAAISVAAAFALAAVSHGGGAVAEVRRDGELIATLPLSEDARLVVEGGYTNVVVVASGAVCIESSDCPGGDCVRNGKISRPGRALVCLPNRVEVRVVSETAAPYVDAVAG